MKSKEKIQKELVAQTMKIGKMTSDNVQDVALSSMACTQIHVLDILIDIRDILKNRNHPDTDLEG